MRVSLPNRSGRVRGALMVELLVAVALLLSAVLPLAYGFAAEKRYIRASYQRAVAMELVDSELEVLAAGGWRSLTEGTRPYEVHAAALTNLPPGKFLVTLGNGKLRLEWKPDVKHMGGSVFRETNLK